MSRASRNMCSGVTCGLGRLDQRTGSTSTSGMCGRSSANRRSNSLLGTTPGASVRGVMVMVPPVKNTITRFPGRLRRSAMFTSGPITCSTHRVPSTRCGCNERSTACFLSFGRQPKIQSARFAGAESERPFYFDRLQRSSADGFHDLAGGDDEEPVAGAGPHPAAPGEPSECGQHGPVGADPEAGCVLAGARRAAQAHRRVDVAADDVSVGRGGASWTKTTPSRSTRSDCRSMPIAATAASTRRSWLPHTRSHASPGRTCRQARNRSTVRGIAPGGAWNRSPSTIRVRGRTRSIAASRRRRSSSRVPGGMAMPRRRNDSPFPKCASAMTRACCVSQKRARSGRSRKHCPPTRIMRSLTMPPPSVRSDAVRAGPRPTRAGPACGGCVRPGFRRSPAPACGSP